MAKPNASDAVLGIDVGTTGAKALLVRTSDGAVLAEHTSEYPLSTPRPLWSEQDPEDWRRGTIKSIRAVLKSSGIKAVDVAGVGLTGQMHGLTLLDDRDQVIRPAILWNDQRTSAECEELTRRVGSERVLELTGNPILPGFTAPKVLWIELNEPKAYARIAHMLLPKDYVRFCLSGAFVSDVADSSGTSMFDVGKRRWSEEMIGALGAKRDWLPEVTESPVASARISARAAKETGLLEGTPIVSGAGDQAAQAVGMGIIDDGAVSVTIGTSGVVFAASDEYRVEPEGKLHAFCHAAPGKWHLMGVMLSAGGSFRWYRDTLGEPEAGEAKRAGRDPYDALLEAAAKVPPGAEGLLFLPYLTGERTPHPDPHARGAFIGLTLRHTKPHMTRAVVEGITFGLRDSLKLMLELGLDVDRLRASGGGAKSPIWLQILADIFERPIETVNVTQGAAYGAALLAGAGVGVYDSVSHACRATVRITEETKPFAAAAKASREFYARYRSLYPGLAAEFRKIGEVVESTG